MQNQYHPHYQKTNQRTLGQSLQNLYKAALTFMVLHPQASSSLSAIAPEQRYSEKSKLYPYLPASEEQRDWLDHIY